MQDYLKSRMANRIVLQEITNILNKDLILYWLSKDKYPENFTYDLPRSFNENLDRIFSRLFYGLPGAASFIEVIKDDGFLYIYIDDDLSGELIYLFLLSCNIVAEKINIDNNGNKFIKVHL